MSKNELIRRLKELSGNSEQTHSEADELLIQYIGDPDVKKAYEAIEKWYA